jgi:hypothetical protein
VNIIHSQQQQRQQQQKKKHFDTSMMLAALFRPTEINCQIQFFKATIDLSTRTYIGRRRKHQHVVEQQHIRHHQLRTQTQAQIYSK